MPPYIAGNPFDKTVIADDNVSTTTKWLTYSCSADWANIGILASKYEVESIDVNQDRTLIVTGNSKACLSLFRYPCVNTGVGNLPSMVLVDFITWGATS